MTAIGGAGGELSDPARALRHAWPGLVAFTAGLAWVAADAVAIALAVSGRFIAATVVAQALIVLTVASFLLGLVALVLRRGRWWGFGGAMLSAVTNPMVMLVAVGFLHDL